MGKAKSKWTKEDYIRAEKKRLAKIFDRLPQNAASAAEKLIDNAAFMAVSLQELQEIINEKGYVEEYQNGANQSGIKKSSECDIYNTMIKNFNATMKQLFDLLPDGKPGVSDADANDPLMKFIVGGGST